MKYIISYNKYNTVNTCSINHPISFQIFIMLPLHVQVALVKTTDYFLKLYFWKTITFHQLLLRVVVHANSENFIIRLHFKAFSKYHVSHIMLMMKLLHRNYMLIFFQVFILNKSKNNIFLLKIYLYFCVFVFLIHCIFKVLLICIIQISF